MESRLEIRIHNAHVHGALPFDAQVQLRVSVSTSVRNSILSGKTQIGVRLRGLIQCRISIAKLQNSILVDFSNLSIKREFGSPRNLASVEVLARGGNLCVRFLLRERPGTLLYTHTAATFLGLAEARDWRTYNP
jgi:hypothetical protein